MVVVPKSGFADRGLPFPARIGEIADRTRLCPSGTRPSDSPAGRGRGPRHPSRCRRGRAGRPAGPTPAARGSGSTRPRLTSRKGRTGSPDQKTSACGWSRPRRPAGSGRPCSSSPRCRRRRDATPRPSRRHGRRAPRRPGPRRCRRRLRGCLRGEQATEGRRPESEDGAAGRARAWRMALPLSPEGLVERVEGGRRPPTAGPRRPGGASRCRRSGDRGRGPPAARTCRPSGRCRGRSRPRWRRAGSAAAEVAQQDLERAEVPVVRELRLEHVEAQLAPPRRVLVPGHELEPRLGGR